MAVRFKLHEQMGKRRLKMTDVIRGTGLGKITISGIYHGEATRVDLKTLNKLCQFLNCSIEELLEFTPEASEEAAPWPKRRVKVF